MLGTRTAFVLPIALFLGGVAAATSTACGSSSNTADAGCTGSACLPDAVADAYIKPLPDAGEYIAFGNDFDGFCSWNKFRISDAAEAVGVHNAGPRTVFINHLPPPGSTTFPIGTIIVKTVEIGPLDQWQVFAMVKRGGSYNLLGALDWEWFGLAVLPDCTTTVEWRGIGPPADAGYGGAANSSCNFCHKNAIGNDFVQTPALFLPNFK